MISRISQGTTAILKYLCWINLLNIKPVYAKGEVMAIFQQYYFFNLYESRYIPVLSILSVPMVHLLLSDVYHFILWLIISYHSVNLLLMLVLLRWLPRRPNEFLCWSRLALMALQRSLKSRMFSWQLNWLFCHPKKSSQIPFPDLSVMRLTSRSPLCKLTKL